MAEMHDVSIKVVSVNGSCAAGHRAGDEWIIKEDKTPAGICGGAFCSIFPESRVLAFGGSFPWSPDPDVSQVACSDAKNPVVFELRRLQN
ncbi:MAG: TIGR04076 family protein [Deltaproteobacteria bacterium]|nr:TIGR04076 family protein [Deltaproteobacteria bacterium]MBW1914786.1 TIGR04076 family protein [Deltaproteobacteria bacterium]